jgi:hypothetical protein
MLTGETVFSGADDPGTDIKVLQSAAGYYIGYLDTDGAPYSRESNYFHTREKAELALKRNAYWRD